MKHFCTKLPLLLIMLGMLVWAGCPNALAPRVAAAKGLLITVSGDEVTARTVYPKRDFSKYELSFDGPQERECIPLENGVSSVTVDDLADGEWTITATAYVTIQGKEYAAAQGSAEITMPAQILNIAVSAQQATGETGFFSYAVTYPADSMEDAKLWIYLFGSDESEALPLDLAQAPSGSIELEPGYYIMLIRLFNGYQTAIKSEIVHIYSDMETVYDYTVTDQDFIDVITLGGKVDLEINGETPDTVRIIVRDKEGNYLGEAEIDEDGGWTVKVPVPDDGTELVIEVIAVADDDTELRDEIIITIDEQTDPEDVNITLSVIITGNYIIGGKLGVTASGIMPLSYQWQSEDEAGIGTINNANTSAYTIRYTDTGKIMSCVITHDTGSLRVIGSRVPYFDMVLVEAGSFQMGGTMVTLAGDFLMYKYPVTQAQYEAVMGTNPSIFRTAPEDENVAKLPVEMVSWYDVLVFCNQLSLMEGLNPVYSISGSTDPAVWGTVPTYSDALWDAVYIVDGSNGYRLPTGAEWEYAAKGGHIGQDYDFAGSDNADDVGWYERNSGLRTHEVMQKAPNALGIYDMSGNVWEWCWDSVDSYYRVGRGGCWLNYERFLNSAYQCADDPAYRGGDLGFRLVRSLSVY